MDIIWACTSTIFICVWVILHLNVPAAKDSPRTIFGRKLKWFCMTILAPELLMLFAGGQWAAARRSVDDMRDRKNRPVHDPEWTMVHAFFAESGGFILHTRDGFRFPVTSKQIHYLVQKGFIVMPSITKDEIMDKSKADGCAKVLAALQATWFMAQIVARGIKGLDVTLLELSTVCLIICTAGALFFWFHKPLDVRSPSTIKCDHTIRVIVLTASDLAKTPYKYTPLDFCDPIEYSSPQFPFKHLWSEPERPLPRIPNDRDSLLHDWKVILTLTVPTLAFGTVQLVAWNFPFPSMAEKLIWRWTCVGGCLVLGTYCCSEVAAIVASGYKVSGMQTFNGYKVRWPWCLIFHGAASLYVLGRLIVITETIISLRALPQGCFQTVNWTDLFPHI